MEMIDRMENDRAYLEKQAVIERLREQGFRITKQRERILDVILDGNCTSSKEIYSTVRKEDSSVGFATVYRMVNLLEEIGLISRKNMYRIPRHIFSDDNYFCLVQLSDRTELRFDAEEWRKIIESGLKACGCLKDSGVRVTGISISDAVIAERAEEADAKAADSGTELKKKG